MILNKNPDVHTFVFIKEFYKASKRLRLSEYLGLIIEPSSLIQDVTVTAQGLIPRFFGYYEKFNFDIKSDNKPKFICDLECVNKYILFTETFQYNGTKYQSRRLNPNGIPKNKESAYNNLIKNKLNKDKNNNNKEYEIEKILTLKITDNQFNNLTKQTNKKYNYNYIRDFLKNKYPRSKRGN